MFKALVCPVNLWLFMNSHDLLEWHKKKETTDKVIFGKDDKGRRDIGNPILAEEI